MGGIVGCGPCCLKGNESPLVLNTVEPSVPQVPCWHGFIHRICFFKRALVCPGELFQAGSTISRLLRWQEPISWPEATCADPGKKMWTFTAFVDIAVARTQRPFLQRLSFQPGLKEQSLKRQSLGHWNLWHAHDLGQTALLNSGSAGSLPCEPRHSREASHHLLDGSDLGGSRNLCEQWRRHRNPGGTRLRLRTCCVWHSCRFSQNQECVRYTERM